MQYYNGITGRVKKYPFLFSLREKKKEALWGVSSPSHYSSSSFPKNKNKKKGELFHRRYSTVESLGEDEPIFSFAQSMV